MRGRDWRNEREGGAVRLPLPVRLPAVAALHPAAAPPRPRPAPPGRQRPRPRAGEVLGWAAAEPDQGSGSGDLQLAERLLLPGGAASERAGLPALVRAARQGGPAGGGRQRC